MRNYQRKRNQYRLPQLLYRRIKLLCLDYDRLVQEAEGTGLVADRARTNCWAIDAALQAVPQEYRVGVERNIKRGLPFPIDAGSATYERQKARVLYRIAVTLGEYPEKE